VGTRKVITDHSTIGIVVTTDGSFGELARENYIEAEEKTIQELKRLRKPFLVLVNSVRPHGEEAMRTAAQIRQKYSVNAIPVNCEQLRKDDIHHIMESLLYEFPVTTVEFYIPKWVEMLQDTHPLKSEMINSIRTVLNRINTVRDVAEHQITLENESIKRCVVEKISMSDGTVRVLLDLDEKNYYEMLSELIGENVESEYQLINILKEMADMKKEYARVLCAMDSVRQKGYGIVTPERTEIKLESPEVIRHGNKFGVKIKAESPSIHMIKANVMTEIAPIVGTQQQAEDLISYIQGARKEDGIWETNIFGKTVEQLVNDGIQSKISMIGEESQTKLQDTMQKIVNDSNGGMVCIII